MTQLEEINDACDFLKDRGFVNPGAGIILGTGLGKLLDEIHIEECIPYEQIPHFPPASVDFHKGELIYGLLRGKRVIAMHGRYHYYEGYTMQQVTLPIRVMQRMGVSHLVVTNAAGAIHPDYRPGDVMLISDHINLMGMNGLNPLRGPNLDAFGERFPDMSQAYDRELLRLARQVAGENGIAVREGVYVGLSGPSFETPADLRFLRAIGADAVGMSTVPEVTVAVHGKTRVLGISGISNAANLDGSTITTHEEVLESGKILVPKMTAIIRGVLAKL